MKQFLLNFVGIIYEKEMKIKNCLGAQISDVAKMRYCHKNVSLGCQLLEIYVNLH